MIKQNPLFVLENIRKSLRKITQANHFLTNAGVNVYINRQCFDSRDLCNHPAISVFVLEESMLECKNHTFKQELMVQVEGFLLLLKAEEVYLLISDIKRALLIENFSFSLSYQGFEISLPEEGGKIARAQMKFKVIYIENIK